MLPAIAPPLTTGYLDTRYLRILQNLADLGNVVTARTNLGLGSMAVINDAPSDGNTYGRLNGNWAVAGGAVLPVVDETAIVFKTGTPANTLTFDVTAYSAARIVTWPDTALTVAGLEVANVFTSAQTIKVNTVTNNAILPVKTLGANVTGAGVGANGFGPGIIFTGESSTTVDQNMAQIASVWTDATHATRSAKLSFYTVNSAGSLAERGYFAATGSFVVSGTSPGNSYYGADVTLNNNSKAGCAILRLRSVTDHPYAGILFQGSPYGADFLKETTPFVIAATDSVNGDIQLRSGGYTTGETRVTIKAGGNIGFGVLATTPDQLVELMQTDTITGAVTDGYAAGLRLDPGYTAAAAHTVTRHNYIDVQNVSVAGVGPAAVTDACVFRFDANAGTHKAVDGASVKVTPGGVDAWVKVNINGTVYYMPAYLSKIA